MLDQPGRLVSLSRRLLPDPPDETTYKFFKLLLDSFTCCSCNRLKLWVAMSKGTLFDLVEDGFPENLERFKGTRVFADDIDSFEIRDDDVWFCGFMRSGTHWAKEMIWRVANDANIKNTEVLDERFPCFESFLHQNYLIDFDLTYEVVLSKVKTMPSPRFLKTHLPFSFLPRQLRSGEKKPKMIYIARNSKDVCISLYYFYKHFGNFKGNLEKMCDLFIADKVNYAPYWHNVLGFWQKRKDFNILFLKYEDMKRDLPSVIRKTGDFFGKNLTEEQVSALSEHLSFERFRKNPTLVNQKFDEIYAKRFNHKDSKGLVRKGTVGQWRQEMTADSARRLDEWIEKNLQNSDYKI